MRPRHCPGVGAVEEALNSLPPGVTLFDAALVAAASLAGSTTPDRGAGMTLLWMPLAGVPWSLFGAELVSYFERAAAAYAIASGTSHTDQSPKHTRPSSWGSIQRAGLNYVHDWLVIDRGESANPAEAGSPQADGDSRLADDSGAGKARCGTHLLLGDDVGNLITLAGPAASGEASFLAVHGDGTRLALGGVTRGELVSAIMSSVDGRFWNDWGVLANATWTPGRMQAHVSCRCTEISMLRTVPDGTCMELRTVVLHEGKDRRDRGT